ncbi:carboxylate-amine ligase [Methyloceanibacter caenitepidi]|uniref:Putative glutamate--cysteine ligase 2 n=1 Tax=Methyloceanibacter caenitepidi TaxID=1384459 RepID=A0A0A8K4V7_9HYPH|nr:carboxylate-amine ligase [Methyloceanibacter caenitepidi]BAQ17910.1 carboxylate-amine ligase bll3764 [Methyloceanibacter caenitepidi]
MATKEPTFSIGIEEEYLLVDKQTRDLAPEPPAELLAKAEEASGGQVSPEFLRSQIEVGTHVCRSVQEARDQLVELRSTVGATAAEFGLAPIAASTHPFAHWDSQHHTNKERYNLLAQDLQYVVRRLVICGMHVHVGIDDDDLRIDLLSQAPYFLPHLLALSTSSPFWQGEATGLKSYRLSVFDELPRTGIPHTFSSYSEYERTIELMVSAGLIEDATKIWWDLRPSARFPTLEMRVTDVCPLIEDAVAIAALFQCILRLLYRLRRQNQRWRHYPPFLIRENRWRAQRYGIEEGMVDFGRGAMVPFSHLIEELFELVAEDAAYFGCTREVAHARTILQRGTSADRQLKCYEKAKAAGASQHEALIAVVDELVAETAAVPGAGTKAVLEGENA